MPDKEKDDVIPGGLFDISDEQISDDDLDALVNSLNKSNDLLDTSFDETYTSSTGRGPKNANASNDEYTFSDGLDTDSAQSFDESQDDANDIDDILNSMPVTGLGFTEDNADENIDTELEEDGSKKRNKKSKSPKEKKPSSESNGNPFGIIPKLFKKIFSKVSAGGSVAAQKVPTKVMYIVLGAMVVISLVFGILLYTSINKLDTLKTEIEQNLMRVSNDIQASTNSSNYIFTSLSQPWNGWNLTMEKMLLDSEASMFYFDRLMDLNSIDVTLTDEAGQLYGVDYSYYSDTLTSKTKAIDILRFQPLPAGTKKFTINIYDLTSKESAKFYIELSNPLVYMPVKYLEEPMEVELYDEGLKFYIEEAVFASSGTSITYKLERFDSNSAMTFADSEYISSKSISMFGGGKEALAINNFPTQYTYSSENTTIGRMTFNPLVTLNGNATISIKNIYKKIDKDTTVEAVNLFSDKEGTHEIINAAPYKIVLENMQFSETMYILTYHAENASIVQKQVDDSISIGPTTGESSFQETKSNEPRKLPAKLSATLIVALEEGGTIEIEGVNISNEAGGEVHFSVKGVEGLPDYVLRKSLSIRVNDISFKLPDINVRIDMSSLKSIRSSTPSKLVSDFLIKAFDDRLKVKSGTQDASILTDYLIDSVINDEKLSEAYAPLAVLEGAQHTSQIISLAKRNDKMYMAVVGVTWNAVVDGKEIHFYRTHKLIVEYLSNGWRITHDEIV